MFKLIEYENYLYDEEKSSNTIQKYIRDIKKFIAFLNNKNIEKRDVLKFKEMLVKNYHLATTNSVLVSVNRYLDWLGLSNLKVKLLKIQKEIFAKPENELTENEYKQLIKTAKIKKKRKLSLLIQTICCTGIRISELKFITFEAIKTGRVAVACKGKNRIVFIPKKICAILFRYCNDENIIAGSIFITKNGKPIDRSNVWKMMKRLCVDAGVEQSKVFPHNLRHLFARTYYKIEKDISKLADILGHSSINTTRIYIMQTATEHIKQLELMNLVYI